MKARTFAFLLIVALLPLAALGVGQDVVIGLKVGQQAPDFTLELHGGESVTLSELRGKPVVLNFWATWCPPCLAEMPDFQEVFEEFGDRIHMLGVGVWEPEKDVDRFLERYDYTYPMAYGTDGIVNTYDLEFIPQTFILNSEGVIVEYIPGSTNAGALRLGLDRAWDEKAAEE